MRWASHRFTIFLLVLTACTGRQESPARPAPHVNPGEVRNVIVLVGDGMGVAHLSAARLFAVPDHRLQVERMPVAGLLYTLSAGDAVTDSAAAATALATGEKVANRVISVDPAGKPLTTALEIARTKGRAAGLVTTTDLSDATPASFAAHATDRDQDPQIALQFVDAGIELMIGAGIDYFQTPAVAGDPSSAAFEAAKKKGYRILEDDASALGKVTELPLLALFPKGENDGDFPAAPLPGLIRRAIELLDASKRGFFLVVEHEGIDTASHKNLTEEVMRSLRSFDEAVGIALDFAVHDGNTLILVAADHETGGLQLDEGDEDHPVLRWTSRFHTGNPVAYFAFGPRSERFGGLIDNTAFGRTLVKILQE